MKTGFDFSVQVFFAQRLYLTDLFDVEILIEGSNQGAYGFQ